jgi:hypothetical protein
MRTSHRTVLAALVVLAALLSVAAAAPGFASPGTSHGRGNHRTLALHTVLTARTVNDAGNGGPGNVVALLFDLQTTAGSEAGHGYISCTIITADVQVCHAGFVLADGQISALASIPIAATTFAAAIIGGTGAYVGVSGQVNNVVTAPGVIDRTFELIFPEHH